MKYTGMTINERLYLSGLLEHYDKAVSAKDVSSLKEILKAVELEDDSIHDILNSLGLQENKD